MSAKHTPAPSTEPVGAHTPGPWSQSHRKDERGWYNTQVYDAAGQTIATLAWYSVEGKDGVVRTAREANARLIAAAPDLLTALRDLLMVIETDALVPEGVSYMRQARAALAKAQGDLR